MKGHVSSFGSASPLRGETHPKNAMVREGDVQSPYKEQKSDKKEVIEAYMRGASQVTKDEF